ncbi:MAG: TetR/AcrR family transcriptional regulator [Thiolinea sp.]
MAVEKQKRGKKTVDILIAAAEQSLGERGYDAFSIQDVVERSGVSVGSIYHHFANRNALIDAVFTAFMDESIREIRQLDPEAASLEEGLYKILGPTRDRFLYHQPLYRAIVERASLNLEHWQPMRELRYQYEAKAMEVLAPFLTDLPRPVAEYRLQIIMQSSLALLTHIAVLDSAPLRLGGDALLNHLVHAAKAILADSKLLPTGSESPVSGRRD